MSGGTSFMQVPGLQLLFWFFDVPQRIAVHVLVYLYKTFPKLASTNEAKQKRDLAYLLIFLYTFGILFTLAMTFQELPMNYYNYFGANCQDLDLGQLKRLFRRLSLVYHPDKNPDPEAVDNFMRLRAAYDTLIDDKKRELYNRIGPSATANIKSATAFNYVDSSVRQLAIDHAMTLIIQFGLSYITPAMRITWWKLVMLSVFIVVELNLISSPTSCGIRVFGHPFLLHELLQLTRQVYYSLNVALSRIVPHFFHETQIISDADVYQVNHMSQLERSFSRQEFSSTVQPFIQEDGTMIEELRLEIAKGLQSSQASGSRPAPPPIEVMAQHVITKKKTQ